MVVAVTMARETFTKIVQSPTIIVVIIVSDYITYKQVHDQCNYVIQ